MTDTIFHMSPENQNKLTTKEAKFILDQAEKILKETGDQSHNIVARTTTLITLVSGFLIALIAFSINRWKNQHLIDSILFTSIFASGYYFLACLLMTLNIRPTKYALVGSEPIYLMVDDFFEASSTNLRETWFYISEARRYQTKIDYNRKVNRKRWAWFTFYLWIVVLSAPIFVLCFIIATKYLISL